jgi:radical SAM protein with 4Fe4S-binding SPASM domain
VVFFNRSNLSSPSAIQQIDSGLFLRLTAEKFINTQEQDTDDLDHRELIAAARKGTFRFICILPTTDCTLQCAYCHQRTEKGRERTMTSAELAEGLAACASRCTDLDKPVDVLLYGGEPLLAFPLTEEILKLTRPGTGLFRQEVRMSFTTTGIGLTPEQAELLATHDVFVIVSIDGTPECHDRVRPAPGGAGSFEAAASAYDLLKEKGARVGLSVTIGRHNIEDLAGQVKFLLERFAPDDIGLNAFLHRRGDRENPFQVSGEAAFNAFIEAIDVTREFGVYAEQPFRRLKPFVSRKPLLKDCSSPGERLVLAPGGVIGFCDSCYPDGNYFYPTGDFPGINHPDHRLWRSLSSPEVAQCRECPAMTVCGGGCRYDAFRASGRLDGVDPERCKFERAFLNWMIWELFDRAKDMNAPFYLPSDREREALFGEVSLQPRNQPFTAGTYSESRGTPL